MARAGWPGKLPEPPQTRGDRKAEAWRAALRGSVGAGVRTFSRFTRTFLAAGAAMAVGVLILGPALATWGSAGRTDGRLRVGQLAELAQRSTVHSRDGALIAVLHDEENRLPVSLDQVPQVVIDAVLDMEDSRFFEHQGIDARGTLRALFTNVEAGSVRQGGSTITQQLVKNALLTPEKSLNRKVKEAVLAVRLEDEMTKAEILERYLNTVFLGNGAYGVQAAAETYFGKQVEDLDDADGALLAGLIRNPVGYDPLKFPDKARTRRDLAVDRMVEMGHVTPSRAAEIKATDVPSVLSRPLPPPNDYFVETVKQALLDDRRLGDTPQERYNAVFRGGLRITTTLDPEMEDDAQRAVERIVPDTKGRFTAAMAVVEPGTGAVRAIVGGRNFEEEKYNLAVQGRRQPGSSFKTFVLAAAIENGYSPKDTIDGTSPCSFKLPTGKMYTPGNYEGSKGGVMSLADATARSVNCAYVRLGQAVGLDEVVDTAHAMGIRTALDPDVFSLPLGSMEVSPLDMAAAYATLANDGVYHRPYFVEKVESRTGKVLLRGRSTGKRAVSVQTARVVTQVLQGVVQKGTGTKARLTDRQVAGKTGTSQDHQNAWFVGYTPQLSAAVWMGSPVGNVSMKNVGGIRVTGGSYPARIWSAFMSAALAAEDGEDFKAPNPSLIPKSKYIRDKQGRTSGTAPRTRSTDTTTGGNASPSTTGPADTVTTPTTAGPPPTTTPPTTDPPPTTTP